MKIGQKLAVVLTAAVMSTALLGGSASAMDSSWGCGGCVVGQR